MDALETFTQWEKKVPRTPLIDRDEYIIAHCRGRDVFHLGACDAPMTASKAERNELLHQKLMAAGCSLVGFDNDRDAIDLLKSKYSIDNIQEADLSASSPVTGVQAEVIVCADIIEHVSNVGQLLRNCNELCRPDGTLLISTINALSLKQAIRALLAREPVHPDHLAYYSYATLGVVLGRHGFTMTECRFFGYATMSRLRGFIFDRIYRVAPQTADGIIVAAIKREAL
jgi:SAM-dependent methyltransferase